MNGKTLGILGGGQLGRMTALAAARLGIETVIFTDEPDSPASQVTARTVVAPYADRKALNRFAGMVDCITYEFENIPVETVRLLQTLKPVFPDDRLLETAQHRVREKDFLNRIGIPTARWQAFGGPEGMREALLGWGVSAGVLKTVRFGYDGKGQTGVRLDSDLWEKWESLGAAEAILEELVDFSCEISVIVARDKLGQMACYGPMLNEHRDHILARTTVPAPVPPDLAAQAVKMTEALAEAVDLVGVLCLELFVTADGRVLANEIAPRTHNSGHWTVDACAVSQFEQQVRAVCGLPVGEPGRHSDAVMLNLIGADVRHVRKFMEAKNACVHLYGKKDARAGRKMGHVTVLAPVGQRIDAALPADGPAQAPLAAPRER